MRCDNIIFEGKVEVSKRITLLYDDIERHNHVITKVTGGLTKKYVCK